MTRDLSQRALIHRGVERRSCAFQMVDGYTLRGEGSSLDGWTLAAHASVTEVAYRVHDEFGSFVETIHRGAFKDTLAASPDVVCLVNHDRTSLPLARTTSGTLQLQEDGRGLRYVARLDPANTTAVALRSAVERRDVTQSSFGFKVTRQSWSKDYGERSIFAVDLAGGDVSPCTFAASTATGDDASAATMRDKLSTAQLNDLPDSAFAYVEPGGHKDASGRTVPRTLRHYPLVDAAHVRNALARIGQGAKFGKEALPAVLAACKKFGIKTHQSNAARTPLVPDSCTCCPGCTGSKCNGTCCDECAAGVANAAMAAATGLPDAGQYQNALDELAFNDYDYRVRIAQIRCHDMVDVEHRREQQRNERLARVRVDRYLASTRRR